MSNPENGPERRTSRVHWVAMDPEHRAVCSTCAGAAYRNRSLSPDVPPRGPWLHLYEEDWRNNPHNVTGAPDVPSPHLGSTR